MVWAADYIHVIDIIDVPTEIDIGIPLTLTGIVLPDNATNKDIIWSVKDAGTTGATIDGNILTASSDGTVIVTATVVQEQEKVRFDYTGAVQTFTVPVTGEYTLEVWGAQGGHSGHNIGGNGGYSKGTIQLTAGQTLSVYVGEHPVYPLVNSYIVRNGGWNGGGDCNFPNGYNGDMAAGGGATDIRVGGTTLENRVIVAGGGGGGGCSGDIGGIGGGTSGGKGGDGSRYGIGGDGGTQTSGFAFGQGQHGATGSAGGGGYWGGLAGTGSINGNVAGGGGSGYIGGVQNGETEAGINQGNGYATITLLNFSKDFPITVRRMHMVDFVDWDGSILSKQDVIHGLSATAPYTPPRTGYTFIGWDVDFSNVTSDLTVTAQYEINKYTVTFVTYDGTAVKTQIVEHGSSATPPDPPTRAGLVFIGWDVDFSNIISDLTVTALWVPYLELAAESGTVTLTASLKAGADLPATEGAQLILAVYDANGRMLSFTIASVSFNNTLVVETVSATLPEGAFAKGFLWNAESIPLIEAVALL